MGLDMADNQKNLQIHCKVGRFSIDVICLHPLLARDSTKTSISISPLNEPVEEKGLGIFLCLRLYKPI
jgi:hypothetical protein